jgi:hypothetical protein
MYNNIEGGDSLDGLHSEFSDVDFVIDLDKYLKDNLPDKHYYMAINFYGLFGNFMERDVLCNRFNVGKTNFYENYKPVIDRVIREFLISYE